MPVRKISPYLLLCVVPLFFALFNIFGPFITDSVYSYSGLGLGLRGHTLPGYPTIDPNIGNTSQALGKRAALDIFSGKLPLWNHYEGFGAPLLGEMQSAAMFPPTLLLALPHGQALEQCLLQLFAGAGAFLFFRRFGLGVTAALAGAVLFELNGVFAWLRNAVFNPVAFLPWLFFSIEGLRHGVLAEQRWSARLPMVVIGAVAGSLALYAGFPEEVYLYALLLAAWVVLGCTDLRGRQIGAFIADGVLAIGFGLALSAPVLVAFVNFLNEADLASHGGVGFYGQWLPPNTFAQYLMPYVYGPIFATFDQSVTSIWGAIGGYTGLLPVLAAAGSLLMPGRRKVKLFLAGWIVIALGATHGWPGIYFLFMQLPLAKMAACFRYLNISWIFCTIFLTAIFIDELPTFEPVARRRFLRQAAVLAGIGIVASVAAASSNLSKLMVTLPYLRFYCITAVLIGVLLCAYIWRIARTLDSAGAAMRLSYLLVAEAALWFIVPILAYPRRGGMDAEAVAFLQSHIGYQRIVSSTTEGRGYGFSPNYGSYFGIPALNFDDIPVPQRTVDYIRENLDAHVSNILLPWYPGLPKEQQQERERIFREKLPAYAQVGVKYVLAGPEFGEGLAAVYKGRLFTVYELPDTRNYFSADGCELRPRSHDRVEASCSVPSELVRLELHMKGWSARVNGQAAAVMLNQNVFQAVTLPAGASQIEFEYEPPGFRAAAVTALLR